MKASLFIIVNIAILPFIVIIGGFSHFSIALFWAASLVIGFFYMRPAIKECGALHFLSPCMLVYLYSIINYVSGAIYYCTDFLSLTKLYNEFFKIEDSHLLFILVFLNLCNSLVAVVGTKYPVKFSKPYNPPQKTFRISTFVVLFAIFVLLHVFIFNLSVIGGSEKGSQITQTATEMNYPFILGIVILIVYKIWSYRTPTLFHLFILVAIMYVLAADSVGSKRELFFVLIAIFTIEFIYHDKRIRLNIKTVLITCTIVASFIFYILTASIARGYGGFEVEQLSDAAYYVSEYSDNENFQVYLGNNFETPYHYATSVISCDYTITGKTPILFGETFVRVLFIAVPRSIYKPRKMIDVFTTAYDAQKRADGVSCPVSAYSEFFANFHILSFPFLYLFFVVYQRLFIKMVRMGRRNNALYIHVVAISSLSLQFIRGSGLQSIIIYSLFASSTIVFGQLLIGDLGRKTKRYIN